MSSASQIDHAATMSEDQLAEMLSKVKSSRETEALRARLPAQLAPFASNISTIEPTQTLSTNSRLTRDLYPCCSFYTKEQRISISVTVAPSPHSESQDSEEPHSKPLELIWHEWSTNASWVMTMSDSHTCFISLQYGPPGEGTQSKATVFTGWYDDDSGISQSLSSHGGIKSVVGDVVRDMGFREGEIDDKLKLEVIEALLGGDGRQILDIVPKRARDGKVLSALKDVIKDELEVDDAADPFA